MAQWIRLHDTVLDDPQLQTLAPDTFRFLINCWLWAARTNNDLGSRQMIAWRLRIGDDTAEVHLNTLVAGGLLIEKNGGLSVKAWDEWQYDSDSKAEYMRKWRASKKSEKRESRVTTRNLTRKSSDLTRDLRVTLTREPRVTTRDITRETQRREEKSREKEKRGEGGAIVKAEQPPPSPAHDEEDPHELFHRAARFACEQLPAGGDVGLTAQAIQSEFQKSANHDTPQKFATAYSASVRKWLTAYNDNRDLRPKQAQWWTRDGTYAQQPPKARQQMRFGPYDLKAEEGDV